MGVVTGSLAGIISGNRGRSWKSGLSLYIMNRRGMGKLLWCSKLSHNNTDSVLNAVLAVSRRFDFGAYLDPDSPRDRLKRA